MEEDSGLKAPVTRLRRRLSVEQPDDVNSPGPATPTKKRGGRLAAKPQLDLIDEITPNPGSATKRSARKASVKEIAEAEVKPVTPSRRSTRIMSNTSIVSETTQSYNSPRAKRAARRASQVGSDSESSVTPARATRRTRMDSASSVEKLEVTLVSKPSNITEVIIEETESSSIKSDTTKGNENTTEIIPTRKSPRLKEKKQTKKNDRKSIDNNSDETEEINNSSTKDNDYSKQNQNSNSISELPEGLENKNFASPDKPEDSSLLMVKELDKKPRNISSNLNKSTSALDTNSFKSKRQRTKSWTITSHTQIEEGMFYSDNEGVKKRFSKKQALKESRNESMHMGSGDHVINTEKEKSIVQSINEKSEQNTSVQKNTEIESSFSNIKAKGSMTPNNSLNTSKSAMSVQTISPQGNKENIQSTKIKDDNNESSNFFEKAPTNVIQSVVFFEDSDTDSKGKAIQLNTEDQCVPVVKHKLVENAESLENDKQSRNSSALNKSKDKNLVDYSCEPMDIDETIPNNNSITVFSQNNLIQTSNDSLKVQEQSATHSLLINNSLNKSSKKSKPKITVTVEEIRSYPYSPNISSQIKDLSSTEHNTSKSPKASNELLSKSVCSVSTVEDKALVNKKLSQDYSTSTPIQQKKVQTLGMQINSSIIDTSTLESKKVQNKSQKELSQISKSSASITTTSEDDSEDEIDSSRPKNSLLDDEAEVASDDYESGDSQDEDERYYEKDNEFVERGETLDSDDEASNDTDYEKDSFVVSSDEEDNNLLSGSGDDLSVDDNDLTMSTKSKNKYNQRKLKDQKKASREMYEARHKLDISGASIKSRNSKRQKIESSEESSEEETIAPVKRNKLRLDSTQDELLNKSNVNNSNLSVDDNDLTMSKKSKNQKKDQMKASREMYEAQHKLDTSSASIKSRNAKRQKIESSEESSEEENIAPVKKTKLRLDSTQDQDQELEMTIYGENVQNHDPLLVQVKLEPKTPMKDMDISTVQINENIEQVCVDNNVSVMKPSETVDPLQATMLGEDSSSLSESSEIMNNYDSILKELNNEKPKKIKSLDMSLNSNKKTKQNKHPIIDQLNITNTKQPKNKRSEGDDVVDSTQSNRPPNIRDSSSNAFEDDSSSVSIDLQLLFSEDSNDFDTGINSTSQKSFKNTEAKDAGVMEDYIPLKRTPGKMNILTTEGKHQYFSDNIDSTISQPLNESIKKRKSKGPIQEQADNEAANNYDIQIIIDPKGTHESSDKSSLNTSNKKKNKKSNATLNDAELSILNDDAANNYDQQIIIDTQGTHESMDKSVNISLNTSTKKKNKKNSITLNDGELSVLNVTTNKEQEVTLNNSKKKNRKSSDTYIEEPPLTRPLQATTNSEDDDAPEEIAYKSTKSKKKNRKSSETLVKEPSKEEVAENSLNMSLNVNSAKKKNTELQNEHDLEHNVSSPIADTHVSIGSAKKQKNANNSHVDLVDVKKSPEKSIDVSVIADNSKKKKNKKLSLTIENEDTETKDETHDISTGSSKKMKNKVENELTSLEETNLNNEETSDNVKKRKRKSSTNQDKENVKFEDQIPKILDDSMISGSEKKKRKISQNDNDVQISDKITNRSQEMKNKSVADNEHPKQNQELEPKKKNKKRKERNDDDANNITKIFKEHLFDKVHVTRLPTSLIKQLDDKPKKEVLEMKKSSVVSTTSFVVQETKRRRNKPSTFLEESVYLNDTHIEKKKKPNNNKPKVLPFLPTAVTSGSGFTTNFKINVIPQEVQFVAQSKNVANFKNEYLYGKKIKRLGTYETYKKQISAKMSKF